MKIVSRKIKLLAMIGFVLSTITACQTTRTDLAENGECLKPDYINQVSGNGYCLAIKTEIPTKRPASPTLFVMVHGSNGPKWDEVLYGKLTSQIEGLSDSDVITVKLTLPGFTNTFGVSSTGYYTHKAGEHWNTGNTMAIAGAIQNLKKHYKAKKVVAYGHSIGATHVANVVSEASGTVDVAILTSCPCDVSAWVSRHGYTHRPTISPIANVNRVPQNQAIYALSGGSDGNTFPELADNYVKKLQATGHNNSYFYEIQGAGHDNLRWRNEFLSTLAFSLGLKLQNQQMAKLPWVVSK